MRKMKANPRLVFFVILSIVVTSSSLGSDPATQRGSTIAVIDMARILREHLRLQQGLAKLEEERKEHEAYERQQRRDLAAQIEELDAIEGNSRKHICRRRQVETAMAELESSSKRRQAALADRSAQLHYKAYCEVREWVKEFAERHRIDLVLNYDSSDTDSENQEEIMQRLQDPVIHNSRLNITGLWGAPVTRGEP
jgi:Skp family chaperone for outer membrane proteins